MRNLLRTLSVSALIVAVAVTLFSSAAAASPIRLYAELLTSTAVPGLPGDIRAQIDTPIDADPYDIMLDGNVTRGDGLGDGYVGRNQTLSYTHRFQPTTAVDRILGAALWLMTADDSRKDGRESVRITLDDEFFASGRATFRVFKGWVSASLFENDGEMVVDVQATRGDVDLVASLFAVAYRPGDGGGSAVPEPGGMALFCAGLGVVGIAKRRRA